MKASQRFYESQDFNNLYIKINHSLVHQKKLELIKNRKNQFLEKLGYHTVTETTYQSSPRKKGFFERSKKD